MIVLHTVGVLFSQTWMFMDLSSIWCIKPLVQRSSQEKNIFAESFFASLSPFFGVQNDDPGLEVLGVLPQLVFQFSGPGHWRNQLHHIWHIRYQLKQLNITYIFIRFYYVVFSLALTHYIYIFFFHLNSICICAYLGYSKCLNKPYAWGQLVYAIQVVHPCGKYCCFEYVGIRP